MQFSLLAKVRGTITLLLMTGNVIFWFVPILVLAIAKLIVPLKTWRVLMGRGLIACAEHWISFNKGILLLTQSIKWEISGLESLRRREWYLMI
ncbi:MAG: acyltransferase, partial [Gammaproteobacteria bacterium]